MTDEINAKNNEILAKNQDLDALKSVKIELEEKIKLTHSNFDDLHKKELKLLEQKLEDQNNESGKAQASLNDLVNQLKELNQKYENDLAEIKNTQLKQIKLDNKNLRKENELFKQEIQLLKGI